MTLTLTKEEAIALFNLLQTYANIANEVAALIGFISQPEFGLANISQQLTAFIEQERNLIITPGGNFPDNLT
jgi:hypothetical protein